MQIQLAKQGCRFCVATWTFLLLFVLPCNAQSYEEKIVAAVLVAEAGNQGFHGMLAVAEVVATRASKQNKTPVQVVTAKSRNICAFSCLNNTTALKLVAKSRQSKVYKDALKLAALVYRSPSKLPGITRGATHFCRKDVVPYWARQTSPVMVLRDHAFYRMKI